MVLRDASASKKILFDKNNLVDGLGGTRCPENELTMTTWPSSIPCLVIDLMESCVARQRARTLTSSILRQSSILPSINVSAVLRPALLMHTSTLPRSGCSSIQSNNCLIWISSATSQQRE